MTLTYPKQEAVVKAGNVTVLQGSWLAWKNLNWAERYIATVIVLMPLWWMISLPYCLGLLTLGLVISDGLQRRNVWLGFPVAAVALFTFGLYSTINSLLYTTDIRPSFLIGPFSVWIAPALLLGYVQSNNIRIRLEVVAWAFSVSLIQMLLLWTFFHFLLGEPNYSPPRSLASLLVDRGEQFIPGSGNDNYLTLYEPGAGIWGLKRYGFFFGVSVVAAVVYSCAALMALDIRKKLWSTLLFVGYCFLVLLSQTRSVWVLMPALALFRYVLLAGIKKRALLCGLLATLSFAILAVPPLTDGLVSKVSDSATALNSFRKDSSEVRTKIYTRTFDRLSEEWLFGHGVNGPTVLPGFDPARIGSHSFLLGGLLYKQGLVGTALFTLFVTAYAAWLYRTRAGRPLCCFLIPMLIMFNSATEEFAPVMVLSMVLCSMVHEVSSNKREDLTQSGFSRLREDNDALLTK
jgi:O-Antigen ligase